MSVSEPPSWGTLLILTIAGLVLVGFGVGVTLLYCDYRRGQDLELTHAAIALGSRCVGTLGEVVPGAIVTARQARPPVSRDSLREVRWRTP